MDESQNLNSKVLSSIIRGYTELIINDKTIFVKHFNPIDDANIEDIKTIKYQEAVRQGLLTEKDRLKILSDNDLWDSELDVEIYREQLELDNLRSTQKNLLFLSQIQEFQNRIDDIQSKINRKKNYKEELIGLTAEKYSEKKGNNYALYYSLYKNSDFKDSYFSLEEFEELDDYELNSIVITFNKAMKVLDEANIKKAAVSNLVQSMFGLAEKPYYFIGKPICNFSYYQITFCRYITYYKYLLDQLGDNMPDDYKNDPDKLEKFYTSKKNVDKHKERHANSKGTLELFGGNNEDMAALGVSTGQSDKMSKALKENPQGFGILEAIRLGI